MAKGQRKANGGFELSESPSHLIRRCAQYFGDLYAHEAHLGIALGTSILAALAACIFLAERRDPAPREL